MLAVRSSEAGGLTRMRMMSRSGMIPTKRDGYITVCFHLWKSLKLSAKKTGINYKTPDMEEENYRGIDW